MCVESGKTCYLLNEAINVFLSGNSSKVEQGGKDSRQNQRGSFIKQTRVQSKYPKYFSSRTQ